MPRRNPSPAVLLAVALAAAGACWLAFHLLRSGGRWQGTRHDGAIELVHGQLKRDYKNAVLTLEIRYQNDSDHALRLSPPQANLVAGENTGVALFSIGASSGLDLTVAPRETKTVRLAYWLEPEHFAGPLRLDVGSDSLPVKSDSPVDIESIGNQETVTLRSPAWDPLNRRP